MVTAENITDEQIRELRDSSPHGGYVRQFCDDALASHDPPMRKRNCRRVCAEIFNDRTKEAK